MKTKLLKKVRNDYRIVYYPDGYNTSLGFSYFKNAYVLYFKDEILRAEFCKRDLIDYMMNHLKESLKVNTVSLV